MTGRWTLKAVAASAMLVTGAALAAPVQAQSEGNIVEVAAEAGMFSTLLAAATEAGLAETLATGGPFTVFAPTDEAFAAIPEADLNALLADKEALTRVLLYHVVEGTVTAEQAVELDAAGTLAGDDVSVMVHGGSVMIDDATVVTADVPASNGVIHVIDKVLMPGM